MLQIGDWGRQGRWNQSETADAMAAAAQRAPPQFVVSVGDNFYPSGLTSVDDANFADSFQNVYHHAELQANTADGSASVCQLQQLCPDHIRDIQREAQSVAADWH